MESDSGGAGDPDIQEGDSEQARHTKWRTLFNFTTQAHATVLFLATIASIISGIIIPTLAVLLGKIFDLFTTFGAGAISGPELIIRVSKYTIYLAGLGSASGISNALFFGLWLLFGELQAKNVRAELFHGMLEKDLEWYDMRKTGIETLISRQQTQIRELQLATSQPIGFVLQHTVTTLASLILALYFSWSLTLVTLAFVPVAAVVLGRISKRMDPSVQAQATELTNATKSACGAISAIDSVKSFNGQDVERWQYSMIVKRAAKWYLRQAQSNATMIAFTRLVTLGMFVQGFWYGSHLIDTSHKSPGDILTAFWACLMAMQSYEQILPESLVLEKGRVAGATLKAMVNIMNHGRKVTKIAGRIIPVDCPGEIEMCNVSFSYPSRPGQPALRNASFLFPAGEITFIVGRSGSGKSTVGNLLMGFYEAQSGNLLIDGRPIRVLDVHWLRENITLLQQQSVLFNESLFKNIAFGRKDHNLLKKHDLVRSIETASLQGTIEELPLGLDTIVGLGGKALSGGQKQRVAIARAHLRDTPILILDEATSALDQISRRQVMAAIRKWRKGKTTIVVTHEMAQVEAGDYAYVLEEGLVVQEGYRASLENVGMGPFQPLSPTICKSPPLSPSAGSRFQMKDLGTICEQIVTAPTSTFDDPMNIDIRPGTSPTTNIFGPKLGQRSPRRFSQQFMSPLPQAALLTTRGSLYTPNLRGQESESGWHFQSWRPDRHMNHSSPGASTETELMSIKAVVLHQERTKEEISPRSPRPLSFHSMLRPNIPATKAKQSMRNDNGHVAPLKKIFSTLWPTLTWKLRLTLVFGFTSATIHAAATPVFSYVFAKLLSTFYMVDRSQRSHQVLMGSLSVLAVAFTDAIASFFMHYLLEKCGQSWIDSLRVEAIKSILDQPRSWFDDEKNSVARLTESLDRNAEEMRNLLGRFAAFAYVAALMTSIAIIWSLVLSWKLTLVGMATGPCVYIITHTYETISGRWESKTNETGSQASAVYTETFTNIRTVRALTLEGYFSRKHTGATSRAFKVGVKRSAFSGLMFGVSDSAIIFVTALIFYYGAVLASKNEQNTTKIITVFTMLLFSLSNANATLAFIPQINSSRSTATQLLRLAHLPFGQSHEHTGHLHLASTGDVTFRNIEFTYLSRPTYPVLSSFNLTLSPASTVALVGASGSGKSTIATLLLGFYPPDSGDITIHNIPISKIEISSLRSLIAIVPQQPTLFPTTITQNITYALHEGSPLASPTNVRAAAQAAGIHTFINSLTHGYDTLIGDGGTSLSGGQAQRIAIARALVRKPKLLILDEATSGLDEETAKGVRNTIALLAKRGTGVLAITHDKAMMRACENIVVMKNGAVCEQGPFEGLVNQKGELRRLLSDGGDHQ